eukprot:IDg1328t1
MRRGICDGVLGIVREGVRGDVCDRMGIDMFRGVWSGVLGGVFDGVREVVFGASLSRAQGVTIAQPQKRRRRMRVSRGDARAGKKIGKSRRKTRAVAAHGKIAVLLLAWWSVQQRSTAKEVQASVLCRETMPKRDNSVQLHD